MGKVPAISNPVQTGAQVVITEGAVCGAQA